MKSKIIAPIKEFRTLLEHDNRFIVLEGSYYASSAEEFAETFSRKIAENSAKLYLGHTLHYNEVEDYYQLLIHIKNEYIRYGSFVATHWKFREISQ